MLDPEVAQRLQYPCPAMHSPYREQLQAHTDEYLYDGELKDRFPEEAREIYKKVKTAFITSCWYPTASFERLLPLERFMNLTMINDDFCDMSTPDEVKLIGERTLAILRGRTTAEETKILMGEYTQNLRKELLEYLPEESLERFARAVGWFFEAMTEEAYYKVKSRWPAANDYFTMRERTICLYPFFELIEVETGVTVPLMLHYHPLLMRLKALSSRAIILMHDLQSYGKDENVGTPDGFLNYVRILQHEFSMSLKDACEETIRLHNEITDEYAHILLSLPDFGKWNLAVRDIAYRFILLAHGWKDVDPIMNRYRSDAAGFVPSPMRKTLVLKACGLIPL